MQEIIDKTSDFVRKKFENEGSGHDWWHIYRVWNNAKMICKEEGECDMLVIELASLLHDIADFKFHMGDTEAGPRVARTWLESLNVDEDIIQHICDIIRTLSFKGARSEEPMKTKEGKIVRDADRLDAIGAIGIARCFAYGGYKSVPIYNPQIKAQLHKNKEEYLNGWNGKTTQINHFYEKLLLLKDLMLTETGKKLAKERHEFMEKYLDQFYRELDSNI